MPKDPSKKKNKKSGNPKKQTAPGRTTEKKPAPKVTSASAWRKTASVGEGVELPLPSGNVCLAINPGMQAFVKQGMIPNSLMPVVNKAIQKAERGGELKPQELEDQLSVDQIGAMVELTDNVVMRCVLQPVVHPVPDPGEERDLEKLYVDEVDLEDKMFIFQWAVGGTADLAQFPLGSA